MNNSDERAVVVTTEHKGIFFGYLRGDGGQTIALRAARLCVYWSADLRGFMGLAVTGPTKGCRIGPAADIEKLFGVTAILTCTPEAAARWQEAPWT